VDDVVRHRIAVAKEILKEAGVELENRRTAQAAQLLEEAERVLKRLQEGLPDAWSALAEN
jgi:predicted component of type VI protein secretion system